MVLPKRTDTRNALRVGSTERPGWQATAGRTPTVGERVYCMEGPGEVTKVLGKTGDGSRLLELRLEDRKPPFFAAASNVLMQDEGEEPQPTMEPPTSWIGHASSASAAPGTQPDHPRRD